MSGPATWAGRQLARRPRSVRARLVATYTVVAVVLASVGLVLFSVLVHRSLKASLDGSLVTRAAPVVSAVADPDQPDIAGLVGSSERATSGRPLPPVMDAVTFVLRPGGAIVAQQPAPLPSSVLATARGANRRPRSWFTTVPVGDDERLRLLLTPVTRAGGAWIVGVGADLSPVKSTAAEAFHQLLIAVPIFIVLAAIGAWLLSGAALRPVERMRADAETIGERDLDARITEPETADELARLARTFNALLGRVRRSVDRQRDLVADASHELRTPLAVLRTELELADRPDRDRAELADAITHARSEVDRLSRLAEDLLFLARADGAARIVTPRRTDVAALLVDAARASRGRADASGVDLVVDGPGALRAVVDPDSLRRALDNLVANALAVTPAGGRIVLALVPEADTLTLSVSDTGPGFDPAFLPAAFTRFRRADSARSSTSGGSGLGLAIVSEIAAAHGGTAVATNDPEGGATVRIRLPWAPPATEEDLQTAGAGTRPPDAGRLTGHQGPGPRPAEPARFSPAERRSAGGAGRGSR